MKNVPFILQCMVALAGVFSLCNHLRAEDTRHQTALQQFDAQIKPVLTFLLVEDPVALAT